MTVKHTLSHRFVMAIVGIVCIGVVAAGCSARKADTATSAAAVVTARACGRDPRGDRDPQDPGDGRGDRYAGAHARVCVEDQRGVGRFGLPDRQRTGQPGPARGGRRGQHAGGRAALRRAVRPGREWCDRAGRGPGGHGIAGQQDLHRHLAVGHDLVGRAARDRAELRGRRLPAARPGGGQSVLLSAHRHRCGHAREGIRQR